MPLTPFDPSSRSLLSPRDRGRFPGATLFDAIGRAVCEADCLPRKELYESWEVARRVRRRMRGGRVVDLACGHGLVGLMMLLLDDSSPEALGVDVKIPASAARVSSAILEAWPRLAGRFERVEAALESTPVGPDDLVVSVHACGELTDVTLDRAIAGRARVAVLPCCHDAATCDAGGLGGWMDVSLAIDATRVARLRAAGYEALAQSIPANVTPKNRLIMGIPSGSS